MPEEYEKWIPVIDHLLWQVYYRVLSFVSFHGPVDEAFKACIKLKEAKGGSVYWVLPKRAFRWDDVEVSPGIKMTVWFFGSAVRRKNTVMCRRGWWAMYLFDPYVKTLAKVMGGLE